MNSTKTNGFALFEKATVLSSISSPMPTLKKRLGASIALAVLSIVSFVVLLSNFRVSTKLQRIALGGNIDDKLWRWRGGEGDGIELVVFGDHWADGGVSVGGDRGESWIKVFCHEVSCFPPNTHDSHHMWS